MQDQRVDSMARLRNPDQVNSSCNISLFAGVAPVVVCYGIVRSFYGSALWDSGIAQWVEHYGIVRQLSGRALWDSGIAQW